MKFLDELRGELKALQNDLVEKQGVILGHQRAAGKIEKAIHAKRVQIKNEEGRLKNMKTETAIHITDHAIVRYLERALGLDIEGFRKQILAGELGAATKCFESGKFPVKGVNGTVRAVVVNGQIVTFQ